MLKLARKGDSLNILSWFTPCNWRLLNEGDLDFGSSGVLLIPGSRLAVSASKEGRIYVLDKDNLGGLCQGKVDTNIIQSFQVTPTKPPNNIHSTPAWWEGPNGGVCRHYGPWHTVHCEPSYGRYPRRPPN